MWLPIGLLYLQDDLVGRLLLLWLIEDVDAPSRLVRRVGNIVPSPSLVLIRELGNRLDVFVVQLDLLEVLSNARRSNRLGNDRVAADLRPCQDDLRGCGALLLRNCFDLRAVDEQWDVEEVVAKGGVGGDVDVLLLGVSDELLAGEDGVTLDLVDGGHEASLLNQSLQGFVCEVGDAHRADFALWQLVHGLPCLAVRDGVVDVNLIRIRCHGEQIRVRVLSRPEVDRPVNEVQVEILQLKFSESVIESCLYSGRIMLRVPQFSRDEDVLTLQTWDVLVCALDALRNFLLVLVAVIGGISRQLVFSGVLVGYGHSFLSFHLH